MHDRGDYKAGWQIEREWDEQQKKKRAALEGGAGGSDSDDNKYVIESDTDDLPFACFICREPFDNPVETKCKHYFCQKCALDRYAKNTTCAACGKQTYGASWCCCSSLPVPLPSHGRPLFPLLGVFNVASKLCDMIERKQKREAAAALAAAREAEEDDGAVIDGGDE